MSITAFLVSYLATHESTLTLSPPPININTSTALSSPGNCPIHLYQGYYAYLAVFYLVAGRLVITITMGETNDPQPEYDDGIDKYDPVDWKAPADQHFM